MGDFLEKDQINYLIYELGLSCDCIFNHINVNYYEEYQCSILSGEVMCNECGDVDNVVFDHRGYTFHTIPSVHLISSSHSNMSRESHPILVFNLVYVSEKWLIVSYGNILNELLFYNGNTFEEIFNKSWGFNGISILPRNQCHVFTKSLKSIVENNSSDFVYVLSYYKQDQRCFVNKRLKFLFPDDSNPIQIQFAYPNISFLDEKETWSVLNNFKKRTTKKKLKRFTITSHLSQSMIKTFNVLAASDGLRTAVNTCESDTLSELINPKLISYQK
jgi:hypothetical protein